MKTIKFYILAFLILLMLSPTLFAQVVAHGVVVRAQYSGGAHPSSLTWDAYITTRPGSVIHEYTPGSSYTSSTGVCIVQLGAYLPWSAGETLRIEFDDGAGGVATKDIVLTNDPDQDAGTVTLATTPRNVNFTTVPAGLTVTIDGTPHVTPYTLNTYQGTVHSISAPTPQAGAAGTQYAWSSWSIGGTRERDYTVLAENDPITATFNTQYQLTVTSDHGTVTGNDFYNAGSSAQFTVSPTTVSGGAGTQYVFDGWSGTGTGSYSGSNSTYTVTMDNPITETAQWTTQYQLTTSVNPPAGGSITPDPTATNGWYDSGSSVELTAANATNYIFAGWGGALSGTDNPKSVTMNAPKSVTANFGQQVRITVNTNPPGRSFVVEGTTYTSEQQFTWVSGATKTLQVTSLTQNGSAGTRYQFSAWNNGGSNPQNYSVPTSNAMVTANFTTQHELTLTSAHGNPSPAAGSSWYNANTQVNVSVTDPDVQGTTRYVLDSWSGDHSGSDDSFNLTMDGPKTVTAAWDTEYYLTVNSDYGNPQGEGWYAPGASAPFSVTTPDGDSNTRHVFQNWSGDHTGSVASASITMNSANTVTANWLTQYYLTTAEDPDAGGDISPAPSGQWYDANSTANLNATVNSGYQWAGWSGSLSGDTKPTTLLMDGPKSVTANFDQIVDITVQTDVAGLQYTVDGTNYTAPHVFTWVVGEPHTLTTTAIQTARDSNFVFISWSDGGARTHTYTVPSSDQTVIAHFEEKREATLTMQRNVTSWGTTDPVPGDHVYDIGDQVTIRAYPEPGFIFKNWSGNVANPNQQITTVFIDNDKTVTAYFGKQDFTLTMAVDPSEGGTTNPPVGDHTYNTYSLVEVTANPNPGWRFVKWIGNVDDSTSATTTIRILDNEQVTAKFEQVTYTLDISVTPQGGGVTVPGAGQHEYDADDVVNLTATPSEGYRFVNWTGDEVDDPDDPTTTITMTNNKAIVANFEPDNYTLTMAVSPEGAGVTVPAIGQHVWATDLVVDISATANEGYRFANWTGDVANPDANITTVTMSSDQNITANFIRVGDVRVTTEPVGLRIVVDGTAYTSPHDFEWDSGTQHTIAIDSTTQSGGEGTQYLFQDWSDEGDTEHTITIGDVSVYTANFNTQHYLTMAGDPEEGGTVTPAPPGGWYDENTKVPVSALADTLSGFRFTGWSGDLTGRAVPDTMLMDAPKTVTANFGKLKTVTIATMPESLSVNVDGVKYETPVDFMWETNSIHSITADTLKSGGIGKRHYFTSWSDGKARSHAVTINSDTTFTADYMTQYYLSTSVEPEDGGQITPEAPGAWYASGTKVPVEAIANTDQGYMFVEWMGDLTSTQNPDTVRMDSAITITALFSSGDFLAPRLVYAFPAKGAQNVPRNTPIQFKLRDLGSGINLATLNFSLEGQSILAYGIDQTGGFTQVDYKNQTCTVYYQPALDLPQDSSLTMLIQCEDNSPAANSFDSTFTFHVGTSQFTHTEKDTLTLAGGVVADDTTGISISVPLNALTDTTEITISVVDDYPELPEGMSGFAMGVHFGPAGLVFQDSVVISIPYDQDVLDSAGVSTPQELNIYYYSMLKGEWIVLDIFNIDENNVYVKVKEFCYLVLGEKTMTLSKPATPDGLNALVADQYYGFATSKVTSTVGDPVEYRFDWGDGFLSFWSPDTMAAHRWVDDGEYGIVAFARSTVDTFMVTVSDTLWVIVGTSDVEEVDALPTVFKLEQNYPNPFNPQTTISFQVPKASLVKVNIYNISGQLIRTLVDDQKSAGFHSIVWNGQNDYGMQVSTGLYFVRMKAGDYTHTIKMSFLK